MLLCVSQGHQLSTLRTVINKVDRGYYPGLNRPDVPDVSVAIPVNPEYHLGKDGQPSGTVDLIATTPFFTPF